MEMIECELDEQIEWNETNTFSKSNIKSLELSTAQDIIDFLHIIGYESGDFISLKALNYRTDDCHYKTFTMPKKPLKHKIYYQGRQSIYQKLDCLYKLNLEGYDILLVPQKRYHYSNQDFQKYSMDGNDYIQHMLHLVIESDKMSKEAQMKISESLKDFVCAVVDSGHISIHTWIKLPKLYCKNESDMLELKNIRKSILNHLIYELDIPIKNIDTMVINNKNQNIRLPYFIHSKSNDISKLIYSNINSNTYYSDYDNLDNEFNNLQEEDEFANAQDSLNNVTDKQTPQTEFPEEYTFCNTSIPNVAIEVTDEVTNNQTTPVVRHNEYTFYNTTDIFEEYDRIISEGVLSGYRISAYRTIYSIECTKSIRSQTFKLDKSNANKDLYIKKIQNIKIESDKTMEYIIEDAKRYYDKANSTQILMSVDDMDAICPDSNKKAVRIRLKKLLKSLGVKPLTAVVSMILEVLEPYSKTFPVQSMNGTLGISNKRIKEVVGARHSVDVMKTLEDLNLVVMTKEYIANSKTRQYWLNINKLYYYLWKAQQ